MSDKQRADHVQAKYWNGFITRTEAQKVFDELGGTIMQQSQLLAKFDAAISCIAAKVGVTPQDVNDWVTKQMEESQKSSLEKAVEKADGTAAERVLVEAQ